MVRTLTSTACLALLLLAVAPCHLQAAAAAAKDQAAPDAETAQADAKKVWTCPRHPEVRQVTTGKCPKCGMDLVPVVAAEPKADDPAAGGKADKPKIRVDEKKHTVTLPATVAEQGKYSKELKGAIEYVLVASTGKTYETLFITPLPGDQVHAALVQAGGKAGKPAGTEKDAAPEGTAVKVFVRYQLKGKDKVRRPVDELVAYRDTGRALKADGWIFTGSTEAADPETGKKVLQARLTGSLIGLHYGDASPLLQNPRPECRKENIYAANVAQLPPAGTAVTLVFELQVPQAPKGWRRVHVLLTGRVQGVGFRNFVVRAAKPLGVAGWVWNLADGRVEAVVEGPKDKVAKLLEQMKVGPRAARVDDMAVTDQTPTGEFKGFVRRN